MEIKTACSSQLIGPLMFRTKSTAKKTVPVYIKFRNECFLIIFISETPENGKEYANRNILEICYNKIILIDSIIKIITINLSEEPFWKLLQPDQCPTFQKYGFTNFSLTAKKAQIMEIRNKIYKKSPRLLAVSLMVPIGVKPEEMTLRSGNLGFILPPGLFDAIPFFTAQAIQSSTSYDFSKSFAENYHFDLEIPAMSIATESVDPIFTLKQLSNVHFSTKVVNYYKSSFKYAVNLDFTLLRSPEADALVSDPPISVNVFRSTTAVGKIPIEAAMITLKEFITTGLWQRTDEVSSHDKISFWMTKIYNRDTWTVPCVSFESSNQSYGVFTLNMMKSKNFIHLVRDAQAFGQFKKGDGSAWLPDIYNSVFIFHVIQELLVIENIEVIGWDFDPELSGASFESLAVQRGQCIANLASYIQNRV